MTGHWSYIKSCLNIIQSEVFMCEYPLRMRLETVNSSNYRNTMISNCEQYDNISMWSENSISIRIMLGFIYFFLSFSLFIDVVFLIYHQIAIFSSTRIKHTYKIIGMILPLAFWHLICNNDAHNNNVLTLACFLFPH